MANNFLQKIKQLLTNSVSSNIETKDVSSPQSRSMPVFNKAFLFIADTHGLLASHVGDELKNIIIRNADKCDACFLLGDIDSQDLAVITSILPKEKCFGIPGNHDEWDTLTKVGVTDLHNKVVTIDGVRIGGIGGCVRYKNHPTRAMLTQDEATEILEQLGAADILISHAPAGCWTNDCLPDHPHAGFCAIDEYIERHSVFYHFHGHLHDTFEYGTNNTKHQCLYQVQIVRL